MAQQVRHTYSIKCGRVSLFSINYKLGKSEQKVLSTGMHTIQDVHCLQCDSLIGWHYVRL